ncbi:MAG: metallophosphoesterase [Clostridia bacterium]|nr:metallophosphoesterase [Clostridia bacterium]
MNKIFSRILICVLALSLFLGGCADNSGVTELTDVISDTSETSAPETTDTDAPTKPKTENEENINMWKYSQQNGITIRDIVIETGKGGEDIEIVQLTDMHLSYVNENDLQDPGIKSLYDSRTWGRNGQFLSNAVKCLEWSKNADQIVITGDIYDYLTSEVITQVNKHIFNAYDNIMACLGNHEAIAWSGTFSERMDVLKNAWVNDVYYSSKVLGDKVMLIQMDNGTRSDNGVLGDFWDQQVPLLTADLATARAEGYTVLLFFHIPLATYNIKYSNAQAIMAGKGAIAAYNYATSGSCSILIGADKEIYDLITTNGDIIKGCFTGHHHSDFYTEIVATDPSGNKAYIPQYTIMSTAYTGGHALRITVK